MLNLYYVVNRPSNLLELTMRTKTLCWVTGRLRPVALVVGGLKILRDLLINHPSLLAALSVAYHPAMQLAVAPSAKALAG